MLFIGVCLGSDHFESIFLGIQCALPACNSQNDFFLEFFLLHYIYIYIVLFLPFLYFDFCSSDTSISYMLDFLCKFNICYFLSNPFNPFLHFFF